MARDNHHAQGRFAKDMNGIWALLRVRVRVRSTARATVTVRVSVRLHELDLVLGVGLLGCAGAMSAMSSSLVRSIGSRALARPF